ncbi:MAG: hypothetical protein ACQEXC_15710 [Pseudomonadota bacterium]
MGGVRFGDVGEDYTKRSANLKSAIILRGVIHNKKLCEHLDWQSIPLGDSTHTAVVTAVGSHRITCPASSV